MATPRTITFQPSWPDSVGYNHAHASMPPTAGPIHLGIVQSQIFQPASSRLTFTTGQIGRPVPRPAGGQGGQGGTT